MNKEKTKAQRGITLVALIITVIILLILAVVSIRAVTGDEKPYGSGNTYQYGNEVTYSLEKNDSGEVTGVKYESAVKSGTSTDYKTFRKPGEADSITAPYTVKSTSYYYYPHSLTTSSSTTVECKGISTSSNAYKAIFLKSDGTSKDIYWLGSSCVLAGVGYVGFGMLGVGGGGVTQRLLVEL